MLKERVRGSMNTCDRTNDEVKFDKIIILPPPSILEVEFVA